MQFCLVKDGFEDIIENLSNNGTKAFFYESVWRDFSQLDVLLPYKNNLISITHIKGSKYLLFYFNDEKPSNDIFVPIPNERAANIKKFKCKVCDNCCDITPKLYESEISELSDAFNLTRDEIVYEYN